MTDARSVAAPSTPLAEPTSASAALAGAVSASAVSSNAASASAVLAGDALATLGAGPVLLYDGSCGVCNRSVQWILSHESEHSLRFAALESPLGTALRELGRIDANVDSVLWVERAGEGVRVSIRSSAAIHVGRYVGGAWKWLAGLAWLVPKPLRDLAYRGFASIRHHVAPNACFLPSPEERLRFLDRAHPAAHV